MMVRVVLGWLILMFLAIGTGAVREGVIVPAIGAAAGHIVGTLLFCAVIVLATVWLIPWLAPRHHAEAWRIGLMWAGLAIAFEFLAGHYLFGTSWERILADYNVFRGRIWILVLVTTIVAPRLASQVRGL